MGSMVKVHRNTLLLSPGRVALEGLPIEETCIYLKSRLCVLAPAACRIRKDSFRWCEYMRMTSGGTYLTVGFPKIRCDTCPKHSLLLVGIEAEIITADVIDGV